MKNIELTLNKIESELNNSNPHAVKTLVNIYKELLNSFLNENYDAIGDRKITIGDFLEILKTHEESLTNLYTLSNTELKKYLNNGDYKQAHCITIANQKLEESLKVIKPLIDDIESNNY